MHYRTLNNRNGKSKLLPKLKTMLTYELNSTINLISFLFF